MHARPVIRSLSLPAWLPRVLCLSQSSAPTRYGVSRLPRTYAPQCLLLEARTIRT